MTDPMQEIRSSFFIECEELLENLFDALETMSDSGADSETINIAFRAVHSIKGGAGAFALDDLVAFAHHFETAMDMVRGGRLETDEDLIALFFRCGDMLSDLVRMSRDGEEIAPDTYGGIKDELVEVSGASDTDGAADAPEIDFQPMALDFGDLDGASESDAEFDLDFDLSDTELSGAHIETQSEGRSNGDAGIRKLRLTFAPEPELYVAGNEPLFLFRTLEDFGPCKARYDFTPSQTFGTSDNSARLHWQIEIETDIPTESILEPFEFVQGLCSIQIEEVGAAKANEPPVPSEPATAETVPPSQTLVDPPAPVVDLATAGTPPESDERKSGGPAPTVRVDLDRIDRLVNLVGELVINQAMLSQSVIESDLPANSSIAAGLDEFMQLTRDIQESVMMIRAQPVKSLFQRMSRIVREASATVGKKVRFETDGETTEIDKTVLERLADPLTHMIRNAVDHGLESSPDRVAAGKPEAGTVTLTAAHRSGRVLIEVSDDGGGINRNRVFDIAVSKGLVSADAQLTEAEIDNLLFLPGFSTAAEISNLSGRGVGMDVVKSAITALGGRVSIQSASGKGTTFSISLPLTLAVLDGMVIAVEAETLVVPLGAIAETLTIKADEIERLGSESQVITVRDSFVPLFDLGVELGYREPRASYDGAIALLIIREDGSRAALVVDSIEDQRQVVIKGLQDSYGNVPGVAAATILGNGRIALILDANDLVAKASGRSRVPTHFKEAS